MSPIGLNSLEARMKVLSANCYNFKKLYFISSTMKVVTAKRPQKDAVAKASVIVNTVLEIMFQLCPCTDVYRSKGIDLKISINQPVNQSINQSIN